MRRHSTPGNGIAILAAAICLLCFGCSQGAATDLVLYDMNPDHQSDGKVTGTLNGQAAAFEYQHTYHVSSLGQKDFKANYVRFAADGPVDVVLTVNAALTAAYLRAVGKDLALARDGSTLRFTLPGPGNYYLQLPDLNTSGRATYTVFFFFDDLADYSAYQQSFAAARNVTSYGVVSSPTLDQTVAIQSVLNGGGSIYFPPGIYRTGQLNFSSNTTVYLGKGAVLKGTDNYNTSRYIYINGKQNVRIAGLGTIDANGHTSANMVTKGHLMDMESSSSVYLDDVVFRNSNSWMLHIRKCGQVSFDNVRLFSGKDGIDPDGSHDVLIERAVVQSVDDGFAVKSKYTGNNCERVTMRDCIVFSCASSLKIGTENYYGAVRDITWDRCDAVDSDRGCILYTNPDQGFAPVSNITWRNIRIFSYPWSAETGGAPFQLHNDSGASVSGLLLENVVAYPTQNCSVRGTVSATFRNVMVNGSSSIPDGGMSFAGVIWPGVTSQSRPVVFVQPSSRSQSDYCNGDQVTVNVQHPYGRSISRVELFVDDVSAGVRTSGAYVFAISGLTLGEHRLKATAVDVDGASNTTAPLRIRVVQGAGPPVQITSGPTASGLTQTSATIAWTTSPAGNSVVEYGATTSYGSLATDSATTSSHSVTLNGLPSGTTYHYRVRTQAGGYTDGVSADGAFTTQPGPAALANPGFEDGPSQTAWVKYGVFDSDGTAIHTGPWFGMMPHSGTYLAGSGASYGRKNGGIYQRLTSGISVGQYWRFSGWVNTYNKGSSSPASTNSRLGVDPYGGTDAASSNVIWSPRVSTQYQWQQVTVSAQTASAAITFFLEAQQNSAVEWNLNAFDDCSIVQLTPISIPQAQTLGNGTAVTMAGRVVTAGTPEIGGAFYIEESNRASAIRVATGATINRGDLVIVSGTIGEGVHGEREIVAGSVTVTQTAQAVPRPVFLCTRSLGGTGFGTQAQGAWAGTGLYNIGLLVRCFGRVTSRGADYFYIDDGTGLDDGSGASGIRVDAAGLAVPAESFALVTGISTLRTVAGRRARAIRPRAQSDITGY